MIQGDITKCFDSIPHTVIMKRINEKFGDKKFISVINNFLCAGHIDPKTGKINRSKFGTPQGGILSPILSNIVLHELDKYMMKLAASFRKGSRRRWNPMYKSLLARRGRSKSPAVRDQLLQQMRTMRSVDAFDPDFRRLSYVRYADDFVVLVSGSSKDAGYLRNNIRDFLRTNCGLELNSEKTLISNLAKEK